ncbi:hypothetical protein [Streptomyces alboflavus]|uniref:hypothetical protein n=1 Tax=Streptomyces alboflavus TaxID=67267 RepID=UPI000F6564D3|nr:hypothetical protein [Streptomyces alboflavus]
MSVPLKEAIESAATGELNLTDPTGKTSVLSLGVVARLWVAVSEDRDNLSLGLLPEVGQIPFTLEEADEEAPLFNAAGALRYVIDTHGPTTRLCTTPGCPNEAIGTQSVLTRVCIDHLNIAVPGMLPNAGDDIFPGDRESAARDGRAMRLDAWRDEIREAERQIAGDLRVLDRLRSGY